MWSRDRPRFPGTLRRGSRDREPPARRPLPPSPCRIRSDVYTGRGPRTRAADGARSAANKQRQEDGRLSVGIEVSHPPRAAAAPTPQNAADGRRALIRGGRQEGRTFRSRSVPVVAVRAAMTRIAGKGAAHLLTSLQAIGLITFRVRLRATTDERPRRPSARDESPHYPELSGQSGTLATLRRNPDATVRPPVGPGPGAPPGPRRRCRLAAQHRRHPQVAPAAPARCRPRGGPRRLDADRAAVRRRRTEQTRERLTKARRETERRPSAKPLVQPGASSFPGQPARAPVILKGMANTLLAHLIPRFPVQSEPIATQALAYVLNAAPDVAKAFMSVMHQTGFEPFERGRIAAEERHGDGIPDLTIRDTAGVVRVLVENKSPKRSPSFVL